MLTTVDENIDTPFACIIRSYKEGRKKITHSGFGSERQ